MLEQVKKLVLSRGYKIFTRPLELNIVGIRHNANNPTRFNDELHVFFRSYSLERYAHDDSEPHWKHYRFVICTDPSCYAYYQKENRLWDGLLEQGQYIDGFKRAHQVDGKQGDVLLQKPRFPIRFFYEWKHRIINSMDMRNPAFFNPVPAGRIMNCYYNICFEPPIDCSGKIWINEFGAASQVFERREDFDTFMRLCHNHQYVYGNNFSYTLIDFKDPLLSAQARLKNAILSPSRPTEQAPDHQAAH
jgi:hypothetical protein